MHYTVDIRNLNYFKIEEMKEYKVINWKMGLSKNNERLEDTLNQHAKAGWTVRHIAENTARIIFELDKNR